MKAYELLAQIKDLCLYSSTGTSRDNAILQRLNLVQKNLYSKPFFWRSLEGRVDLYTSELMTLDTAPSSPWAVGDTITGATSGETCVIVDVLTTKTFNVKDRSGDFSFGEVLSNGTYSADQGTGYPTFSWNSYTKVPPDVGLIFDLRQMTTTPYAKLEYVNVHKMHEIIPQPAMYAYSRPRFYTWWDGRIWWYPIPDDDYTLTMYYYKKPSDMKIYSTGTAAVSGAAVTGTNTYFSTNANVEAGMYFALTGDALSNGTYPWAEIDSVDSTTSLTLKTTYSGGGSGTSYVCSSESIFGPDFDSYFIFSTALMEIGRMREMSQLASWMREELSQIWEGLVRNQNYIPDYTPQMEDFQRIPILLGDDYAKFPFIGENL